METTFSLFRQIKFPQMRISKQESAGSLTWISSSRLFTVQFSLHTPRLILMNPEKSNNAGVHASFSKLKELRKSLSIKSFRRWLFSVSKINGLNIKCNNAKRSWSLLNFQRVILIKVCSLSFISSDKSLMKIILKNHFFRNW